MIDVPRDDLVLMMEAGYVYLAMAKFNEAKQLFEGIGALVPKHEVPKVAVGLVYFAQKKYLPAIRSFREAIELNPESAFAHAHLAESFLFYGKKEDALKELNEAMSLETSGPAYDFARSLQELIAMGFDPVKLAKEKKK